MSLTRDATERRVLRMVIQEYVQFQESLVPRDREVLDRLVARIAELTIQRGVVPGGAALATRIQQASRSLTMEESKALAAYSLAAIASSNISPSPRTQAALQQMLMSFKTQYLQLQNSMQNANRSFTMVKNAMKTKHDTVKNSISNIH
jgi:hypothetical protein